MRVTVHRGNLAATRLLGGDDQLVPDEGNEAILTIRRGMVLTARTCVCTIYGALLMPRSTLAPYPASSSL